MPTDLITLAHFSVSSAINLLNSVGDAGTTEEPRSPKKIGAVGKNAAGGDEVAIGTPRPTQLARRTGGEGPLPRDPLAVDGVEVAGIRTLIAVPMLRRMRRSAPSPASICRTTCHALGRLQADAHRRHARCR
jgi:hypothetical protein